jgi:predicted amino acid-binding ACT domain protein
LRVSGAKKGFLIQGDDRVGAVHRHLERLAEKKVNVVAADAISAGKRRYGMILWVKPKDYARAARALRVR